MLNFLKFLPTLTCLKIIGLPSERKFKSEINNNNGDNITMRVKAVVREKKSISLNLRILNNFNNEKIYSSDCNHQLFFNKYA